MRLSDIERFVGIPYCEQTMDCADLVVLVQRELFGREVTLPNGRPRGVRGQLVIGELSRAYGAPTDSPQDGDLVLMSGPRTGHVGVYFFLAHEPHVLHVMDEGTFSELLPVRELKTRVEGYFSWV